MMKCLREVFKFLLMGLLVSSGLGEETGAGDPRGGSIFQLAELEPAPSSWILDHARLFDEGEIAQLSARLEDFRSRFEIQIFVVAYSVLIGETIEDRAKRLRGSWLADGSGIVVGYERGGDRMAFSATGDPLNTILKPELEFLFADAYEAAAQHQGAAGRVRAAVEPTAGRAPERHRAVAERRDRCRVRGAHIPNLGARTSSSVHSTRHVRLPFRETRGDAGGQELHVPADQGCGEIRSPLLWWPPGGDPIHGSVGVAFNAGFLQSFAATFTIGSIFLTATGSVRFASQRTASHMTYTAKYPRGARIDASTTAPSAVQRRVCTLGCSSSKLPGLSNQSPMDRWR